MPTRPPAREFFADVARDIIRWMDEWLSDRERGGFYASQDADYSMDDDGDYFTWTLDEARAVLTEQEAEVASLHYDINEIGEMHHNPAKNVLFERASVEEIAARTHEPDARAMLPVCCESAKRKMYAARLQRPTPYVDKTMYTGWNAMCVSAYLEAAKALRLDDARHFALRSLDRILAEAWQPERGLSHVIAYSDPSGESRSTSGMLDDYAFVAIACLDAYEATTDLSYFRFANEIGDEMIKRFFDPTGGGFFDTELRADAGQPALGVLGTRRKPFQDSPTPAGNPVAAIALLRLYAYSNQSSYREKAEQTLEVLAGVAGQFGIFAATYGIAATYFSQPHTQVAVLGEGNLADELYAAAVTTFEFGRAVLKIASQKAVPENLPPALAETIPNLPAVKDGKTVAVICSNFACQQPIADPDELKAALRRQTKPTQRRNQART